MAQNTPREMERVRRKASRIFFLITALCIMSFTAGIVIGIKFAGGTHRELVDKKTFNAVADISRGFPLVTRDRQAEPLPQEKLFPKSAYPYVIAVTAEHDHDTTQKLANYLSRRGHTVILSKNNSRYRIFIGPYRNSEEASGALKKIAAYQKYSLAENTRIIKR